MGETPQERAVRVLRRYLGPGVTEDEHGEAILTLLAECATLRAEVERLTRERDAKIQELDEYVERAQHFMRRADKAEASLLDCWAVMDASQDRRERELARKMRAALRDTAPEGK